MRQRFNLRGGGSGLALATSLALCLPAAASATDLFSPGSFPAMASDRQAAQVGDSLTVVIYEASTASNSTQGGARGIARLTGSASDGQTVDRTGRLDLSGSVDTARQTERTGKMVAQISVVVEEVLPNGDLRVTGEQLLNVNGQRTRIKVRGRVRPLDISSNNVVLSTRLADALIEYDGSGFTRAKRGPGVIGRLLGHLRSPG